MAPLYSAVLVGGVLVVSLVLTMWKQRSLDGDDLLGLARLVPLFLIAGCATFAVVQLVPYGRTHDNPDTTGEPAWSSPRTRELMVSACYGCHSNQVDWPWYSSVAPISWAITDHVEAGRDKVNYSEFATDPGDADESVEVLEDGSMPPTFYTRFGLHPEADLSDAEITELVAGLQATPGLSDDDFEPDDDNRDDQNRDDADEDD